MPENISTRAGECNPYVGIHNLLVRQLDKDYFDKHILYKRPKILYISAAQLSIEGERIRLAILCGVVFGAQLGILFGLGLLGLARVYPKKSTYPALTWWDVYKGVLTWFGGVLLASMTIAGGFYALISEGGAIIEVVQWAGYAIGIVGALLLYYYAYVKRVMLRKRLIQAQGENAIEEKSARPSVSG